MLCEEAFKLYVFPVAFILTLRGCMMQYKSAVHRGWTVWKAGVQAALLSVGASGTGDGAAEAADRVRAEVVD